MLLRRDLSDTTIIRILTLTVTSSLQQAESFVQVTLTVPVLPTSTQPVNPILLTSSEQQPVNYYASTSGSSYTPSTSTASSALTTMRVLSATPLPWKPMSKSLNSNLGLAIGIPMAVVAAVILACVAWLVMRKVHGQLPDVLAVEKTSWRPTSPGSKGLGPRPDPPKRTFLNRLSRILDWPASPATFCPPILRRFHLLASDKLPNPPPPPEKPAVSRVVVRSYTKRLADELSLLVGQSVEVIQTHLDGWALVRVDGNEGVVPMACLGRSQGK